jgi:MFS family permease
MARSLGGSSVDAFWAGTSYLLASAVSQPVIASISESFGRQQQLIVSLVLFTFGTALCAVAHDFGVLLTGRCIQGIGGGGIVTLAQVIFCDIVPLRQRPKYFSLVLASWSVGSIVGPVVGGCPAEKASWRWCFHINFPFCAVGLVVASLYVRLDAASNLTIGQRWRHTDWFGAALFVGSTTSLLIGTSWGGIQHRWLSGATLAPIASGLVGIVVFLLWQRLIWPRSLLPLSLFCTWSSLAAFYCALVNGFVVSIPRPLACCCIRIRSTSDSCSPHSTTCRST